MSPEKTERALPRWNSFKDCVESKPPLKQSLHIGTVPRPDKMSDLSGNAECVLRILKDAIDPLTTAEILETARREAYADICQDCAGGDTFVVAARQLVDKGLITKKLGKGGYRWQMAGGN